MNFFKYGFITMSVALISAIIFLVNWFISDCCTFICDLSIKISWILFVLATIIFVISLFREKKTGITILLLSICLICLVLWLAFLGIYDPSNCISEQCEIDEGIVCEKYTVFADGRIVLRFENKLTKDLTITNISLTGPYSDLICVSMNNITLQNKENAEFEFFCNSMNNSDSDINKMVFDPDKRVFLKMDVFYYYNGLIESTKGVILSKVVEK